MSQTFFPLKILFLWNAKLKVLNAISIKSWKIAWNTFFDDRKDFIIQLPENVKNSKKWYSIFVFLKVK